jgi:predicted O-methyltransferase YrrM
VRRVEPLINLALLLPGRPREFRDRVAGYAELGLELLWRSSPAYESARWQRVLGDIEAHLGGVTEILDEPALKEVEEDTRRLLEEIRARDPFSPRWAADSRFARLGYLLCRLISPSVVLETGVAYGVSSVFILKALEVNGRGTLHSIDLPPLRSEHERFWRLHRGSSARVLPRLLEEASTIDLFVHDSLHTLRNMRREFDTVWPHLRNGAVLMADDVERNSAFSELRRKRPALWRVVQDREESPLHGRAAPVVFGIAIK